MRGDVYVARAEAIDFESPESRATSVLLTPP
jgi:hypothetical protein